jgi:hypothetical protein
MKWPLCFAAGIVIVSITIPEAHAQTPSRKYGELLKRLPETANVLLLVDVDGLLNSPFGQREKWRDTLANRPTGALGVSTDASKFVVAMGMDLQTLNERWKLGMLQTKSAPPQLTALAGREGGYVEQLETQNVAFTPRGFYLFSFPEQIIGFAAPSDRQLLAEWIKKTLIRPRAFPPSWADRALFRAEAGSQVVLAIDLEGAVSRKQVENWIKTSDVLKSQRMNASILSGPLASAKLAFLQIDVKENIQGTLRVEFDQSIDFVAGSAKDIVLSTLGSYGAELSELKSWSSEGRDRIMTLTGPLTEDAVRRILSLVSTPTLSPDVESLGSSPTQARAESAKTEQAPAEPSRDAAVKISQRYFRSVVDIAQSLKKQKTESSSSMRLWYDRAAKQIEELPLLNVDNELLDWGSQMARTIREMSLGINYAAKDQTYRISGTPNGYYGGYGYGGSSKSYDSAVITRQSNAVLNVQLDQRWQVVETAIADMRKKMVMKYNVNF